MQRSVKIGLAILSVSAISVISVVWKTQESRSPFLRDLERTMPDKNTNTWKRTQIREIEQTARIYADNVEEWCCWNGRMTNIMYQFVLSMEGNSDFYMNDIYLADLDDDGLLELISTTCQGSGAYSYTKYYRPDFEKKRIKQIVEMIDEHEYIAVDWPLSPCFAKSHSRLYWLGEDVVCNGTAGWEEIFLIVWVEHGRVNSRALFRELHERRDDGNTISATRAFVNEVVGSSRERNPVWQTKEVSVPVETVARMGFESHFTTCTGSVVQVDGLYNALVDDPDSAHWYEEKENWMMLWENQCRQRIYERLLVAGKAVASSYLSCTNAMKRISLECEDAL